MYLEKLLVCNAFIKLHVHAQTVPTFHAVTVVVIPGKLLEQVPQLKAQFSPSQYSTSFFYGKDAMLQGFSEQPSQLQQQYQLPCCHTQEQSQVSPSLSASETGFSCTSHWEILPVATQSSLLICNIYHNQHCKAGSYLTTVLLSPPS